MDAGASQHAHQHRLRLIVAVVGQRDEDAPFRCAAEAEEVGALPLQRGMPGFAARLFRGDALRFRLFIYVADVHRKGYLQRFADVRQEVYVLLGGVTPHHVVEVQRPQFVADGPAQIRQDV